MYKNNPNQESIIIRANLLNGFFSIFRSLSFLVISRQTFCQLTDGLAGDFCGEEMQHYWKVYTQIGIFSTNDNTLRQNYYMNLV
jgi:hypothetical protein